MAPVEPAGFLPEGDPLASAPPDALAATYPLRSFSLPNGQSSLGLSMRSPLKRSTSLQGVYCQDIKHTSEIQALVQELAYHTDLSQKQLQELWRRLQAARSVASHEATPELTSGAVASKLSVSDVLLEFDLPTEPEMLRLALAKDLRRPGLAWHLGDELPQPTPSSPSQVARPGKKVSQGDVGARSMDSIGSSERGSDSIPRGKSGDVEDRLRMAVRCQISHFLKEARNRVKVVMLWRHEAGSISAVQACGSVLSSQAGDKWYGKLYMASEAMLSNLLDENDSPIREVVFDLVSYEAKRLAPNSLKSEQSARPPQVEAMRKVFRCFADAVLAVRARPSQAGPGGGFERAHWADCLSRLAAQFEAALDETWRRLWPGARVEVDAYDEGGAALSPLAVLRRTLLQSSENASLLGAATAAIADSARLLEDAPRGEREDLGAAYLRQAIRVGKGFLQLAREMSVLAGLWMSGRGLEGEQLSLAVHRQEYRRVRRAFAELLLKESAQVLAAWSAGISRDAPACGAFLRAQRNSGLSRKMLSAVIEWWRTGHSGKLRTACMDLVSSRFDQEDQLDLRLEEVQSVLPILEELVLETLHRELAVRSEQELSAADEPRVRDILARLTHELGRHIESEWLIAETARDSAHDTLPPPSLFQVPQWRPPAAFDFGAPKTAFLGSEISGRYIVTRYVSRGAMGRVWVVEDRLQPSELPLCLKTFYCGCECEEASNLPVPEFKRCILEELSQVERWLTSRTRLATSRHLVQVVRVFREAPVVRTSGGVRVEGVINGILMEFCDRGELTSYLWDERACRPRAFDERTAQYLFVQLMELLVELFAPQLSAGRSDQGLASDRDDLLMGSMPSLRAVERDSSIGAMSMFSMTSEDSRELLDGMDSVVLGSQHLPIQYFHNDIKTENLVFSGTTLKLIDFQSLTPLRHSRGSWHPQLEHATVEYQHRNPGAMGESMSARAEGVAVWACGVILTRLLAAELGGEWVHRHRGLGAREALERLLPRDHCLLADDELGPRGVLDRIFSAEVTPSIAEVLDHPWVRSARTKWQDGKASAAVQAALEELRPQGCDPRKDLIAWIPLTGCLNVEGQPPPVQEVDDIIRLAIDVSGGQFRQDGQRRCSRRTSIVGDIEPTESFHEWHVTLCDTTAEDGDAAFGDVGPGGTPAMGPRSPSAGASPASPGSGASPASGSRFMWQRLRTRLVLDRFCIHLRPKESLDEDEPTGVWWLRLKWLPAMVAGKRDTLGGLTLGRRRMDSGAGLTECGGFVLLQQLLLEGRREAEQQQRLRRSALQERRPAAAGPLALPILGR